MKKSEISFIEHRILVTGSRGKSSLVRMICAGLIAGGLDVRGRITGVLPRELSRVGERRIVRNAPAHVEEMRWWLGQVSRGTGAVVMENAAVNPDLQCLAAAWLEPTLTVWTNARPDHQDQWGEGSGCAEAALLRGIPDGGVLALGAELAASPSLMEKLKKRSGSLAVAPRAGGFLVSNRVLALAALESIGFAGEVVRRAVEELPPDIADFRVFEIPESGALLAAAFSANDPESTEMLFASLGWRVEETSLLYADRGDRRARLKSFAPFMNRPWREVKTITDNIAVGTRIARPPIRAVPVAGPADAQCASLREWMRGKKIFGCGNVAGVPLALLDDRVKSGSPWTTPGA